MADDEFSVSDLSLTLPVEAVDELQALEAIYDTRLTAYSNSASNSADVVYLLLNTCLPSSPADPVSLVISLSKHYPFQAAPQLQLANTFLSSFAVPDELFASVLTTYMHEKGHGGVSWNGAECLYDGIEWVRNMCDEWVRKKTNEVQLRDRQLKADKPAPPPPLQQEPESSGKPTLPTTEHEENVECPPIYSCEPIIDRKSVFVGHAARVNSHDQVKAVIDTLLSNNKIAKATHNIQAYTFVTKEGTRHADNDDDGESAAGSRLAQLLELLDVQDVIVVVSRWYGGLHLGPDRFRHINNAARSALEGAGFLPTETSAPSTKKRK